MKSIASILTNLLLAVISLILFLIFRRMPPTVAEIAAAKGADRKALTTRQPVVKAVISDTIDVNVENALPIPVTIEK